MLKAEQKPYHPQGKALDILKSKAEILLVDGPAGTGKSRACLEKLHLCAERFPGMRGMILRKTRKSCTNTCLVTFEDEVVPAGHPALKGAKRANRSSYVYPNGSEIVVGGMDDRIKVMSSQYDIVYGNESIEFEEDDIQALSSRMRNGKMPYDMILLDTNPGPPTHWLWQWFLTERLTRIQSTIQDNRRFWNESLDCPTPEGEKYLAKLKRLTGNMYDRLYRGVWAIAEGARFKQLDPLEHLFDFETAWPKGIPSRWKKFVSIDHGISAPYCALWHAVDEKGNVWTYQEDYEEGCPADIQAQRVIQKSFDSDVYFGEYLDPSMWSQDDYAVAINRGKRPEEKSAAQIYREILGEDDRFGPVIAGTKRPDMGLHTLDMLLNRGNGFANWYIERGCENLWKELNSAVFYRTPQGIWTEKLDPKCADHAITSAVYGLHAWYENFKPKEEESPDKWIEDMAREKAERRRILSERNFKQKFGDKRRVRF